MKKIVTGLVMTSFVAGAAFADANADIQARQAIMKSIAAAAKAGDMDALAKAADAEVTVPAFMINTAGQGDVKTTALDKIWDDFDAFKVGLVEMSDAAAAGDKDAVFATCKACHGEYRAK